MNMSHHEISHLPNWEDEASPVNFAKLQLDQCFQTECLLNPLYVDYKKNTTECFKYFYDSLLVCTVVRLSKCS